MRLDRRLLIKTMGYLEALSDGNLVWFYREELEKITQEVEGV